MNPRDSMIALQFGAVEIFQTNIDINMDLYEEDVSAETEKCQGEVITDGTISSTTM
jgi:hypothetical protein